MQFFADANEAPDSNQYKFWRGIEKRFSFLEAPRSLEDYDLNNGVNFRGGSHKGVEISRLTLHGWGIYVEGASLETDHLEEFLEEFSEFLRDDFGFDTPAAFEGPRVFKSTVVTEVDFSLDHKLEALVEISKEIQSICSSYGIQAQGYKPIGFLLGMDTANQTDIFADTFRFERRANVPHEERKYFSSAPLKSKDHQSVLGLISRLFGNP